MNTIESHVVSLETAKRMKSLGWDKDTMFSWSTDNKHLPEFLDGERMWYIKLKNEVTISVLCHAGEDFKYNIDAPLATEILEEFPSILINGDDEYYLHIDRSTTSNYEVSYADYMPYLFPDTHRHSSSNLAEALALLWCELKEKGII